MYLTPNELAEVRREVHNELAEVYAMEQDAIAGSYRYLCCLADDLVYAHRPVGRVVREIVRTQVA